MKKYYLLVIVVNLLVFSCRRDVKKEVNKVATDSLHKDTGVVANNDLNKEALVVADRINARVNAHQISSLSINYPYEDSKEKLTLFYDKHQAIKLEFPMFDVTGEVEGIGEYYFNKEGEVFLKVEIRKNSKTNIYIDLAKHLILDNNIQSKSTSVIAIKECEIIQEIDNLMRSFSSLAKYKIFACRDSSFDLIVHADSVVLFKDENLGGEIKAFLPYGTHLKYIQRSSKVGSMYQYLIKVYTDKGQAGWVNENSDSIINVNELDE